jgi:hypothetical protein
VPHCQRHTDLHQRLQRELGRTYGARCKIKDKTTLQQVSGQPTTSRDAVSILQKISTRLPGNPSVTPGVTPNPQALRKLEELLQRYPPYGDELSEQPATHPEWICQDCDGIFPSSLERNEHYLSRYCSGSAAVVHLLIIDKSRPEGYHIEEKHIPFDSRASGFKCSKCSDVFLSTEQSQVHERTHAIEGARCLYCAKSYDTEYELQTHYDWHDDMEFRHQRDGQKAQMLKLSLFGKASNVCNLSMDEIPPGSPLDVLGVKRVPIPSDGNSMCPGQNFCIPLLMTAVPYTREDGELVAISLVGAEDMERSEYGLNFRPRYKHSIGNHLG